jgi:hypothetical protein
MIRMAFELAPEANAAMIVGSLLNARKATSTRIDICSGKLLTGLA